MGQETFARLCALAAASATLACLGGVSSPVAGFQARRTLSFNRLNPSKSLPLWSSAGSGKRMLFVSIFGKGRVLVYDRDSTGAPVLEIEHLCKPSGVTVNSRRQLYVAEQCQNSGIAVFPPGQTKPSAVLVDAGYLAAAVAVSNDGTVFDLDNGGPTGNGRVAIFANGSLTPTSLIIDFCGYGLAIALDTLGNLYVSYLDCQTDMGHVRLYAKGSHAGTDLGLVGLLEPLGIAIDSAGNVVIADGLRGGSYVKVFRAGTTAPSIIKKFDAFVQSVAFSKDGETLFVSENHRFSRSYVAAYRYPALTLNLKYLSPAGNPTYSVCASPPQS